MISLKLDCNLWRRRFDVLSAALPIKVHRGYYSPRRTNHETTLLCFPTPPQKNPAGSSGRTKLCDSVEHVSQNWPSRETLTSECWLFVLLLASICQKKLGCWIKLQRGLSPFNVKIFYNERFINCHLICLTGSVIMDLFGASCFLVYFSCFSSSLPPCSFINTAASVYLSFISPLHYPPTHPKSPPPLLSLNKISQ